MGTFGTRSIQGRNSGGRYVRVGDYSTKRVDIQPRGWVSLRGICTQLWIHETWHIMGYGCQVEGMHLTGMLSCYTELQH